MLNIDFEFFSLLDYSVSYLEFFATLFGLFSVYLAAKTNIWTWPTGIVNEIGFFLLFFQFQLYANMALQVFFFVATLYGWVCWGRVVSTASGEANIGFLSNRDRAVITLAILLGWLGMGMLTENLHDILPSYFAEPAALPYVDSLVTAFSIAAMLLLAKKRVESWVLWLCVDFIAVVLYVHQGIYLVAIEYGVFSIVAVFGLARWLRLARG